MRKMRIVPVMLLVSLAASFALGSCSSGETYAELLRDERKVSNKFLSQFRIENEIPEDTIFEVGEDAPYYRIEEEGNVYMQVLKADSLSNRPSYNDRIYFRFLYFSLYDWDEDPTDYDVTGNAYDMQAASTYFLYGNFDVESSYTYGYGIQLPLLYLGVNSEVNLLIKSQYGFSDYIAYVIPYHFNVRYFNSMLY